MADNPDVEALRRLADMFEAIDSHPEEGLVYEDHLVRVERVAGKIVMEGKPIRVPFRYEPIGESARGESAVGQMGGLPLRDGV